MTNLFNIQNSITVGDVTHFVQFNKISLTFFLHLCLHLFETCYLSCLSWLAAVDPFEEYEG